MKRLLTVFLLFAIALMSACSSSTHYDSVSSTLVVDVAKEPNLNNITVRQHFMFDRDLENLSGIYLVEAWLSSPEIEHSWDNPFLKDLESQFLLDIVENISISILDPELNAHVAWLMMPSSELNKKNACFEELPLGDLHSYFDEWQQMDIQVEISLNPNQVMKYWRDVCSMGDSCLLRLPLSMQFEMDE